MSMKLEDALHKIAAFLDLDGDKLVEYAAADTYGGYHPDAAQQQFPVGSLFAVEGQVLYALVRALRPKSVLELGVNHGASTTHLIAGVKDARRGVVTSVDLWEGAGYTVPDELTARKHMVYADALDAIVQQQDGSIGLVFEDLLHGDEQVRDVVLALRPKLAKGAVVVHHDSEHGDDGVKVRRGLDMAVVSEYLSVLIEPSDCGLAVWRNG